MSQTMRFEIKSQKEIEEQIIKEYEEKMKKGLDFWDVFAICGSCGYEDVYEPYGIGLLICEPHPTQQYMICCDYACLRYEYMVYSYRKMPIETLREIVNYGLRALKLRVPEKYKKFANIFEDRLVVGALVDLYYRAKKRNLGKFEKIILEKKDIDEPRINIAGDIVKKITVIVPRTWRSLISPVSYIFYSTDLKKMIKISWTENTVYLASLP